jgi:hypothetical protein
VLAAVLKIEEALTGLKPVCVLYFTMGEFVAWLRNVNFAGQN